MVVVSIYDAKAECYSRPNFVRSAGEAWRFFEQEVNRAADDNMMFLYPQDYTLFEIGTFDELTGKLAPRDVVLELGNGMTAVDPRKDEN